MSVRANRIGILIGGLANLDRRRRISRHLRGRNLDARQCRLPRPPGSEWTAPAAARGFPRGTTPRWILRTVSRTTSHYFSQCLSRGRETNLGYSHLFCDGASRLKGLPSQDGANLEALRSWPFQRDGGDPAKRHRFRACPEKAVRFAANSRLGSGVRLESRGAIVLCTVMTWSSASAVLFEIVPKPILFFVVTRKRRPFSDFGSAENSARADSPPQPPVPSDGSHSGA